MAEVEFNDTERPALIREIFDLVAKTRKIPQLPRETWAVHWLSNLDNLERIRDELKPSQARILNERKLRQDREKYLCDFDSGVLVIVPDIPERPSLDALMTWLTGEVRNFKIRIIAAEKSTPIIPNTTSWSSRRAETKGKSRNKSADWSYMPKELPAVRSSKWPTFVVEVGWSEPSKKLDQDARWWLEDSKGDVMDMKKAYDKKHTWKLFLKGEKVLIRLHRGYRIPAEHKSADQLISLSPKLQYQFAGPFTVQERVGRLAYRLDLPDTWKIHPVIPVSDGKALIGNTNNLPLRVSVLAILWGIITMCLGFISSYASFVAVRALLGIAEGSLLPGMVNYLLYSRALPVLRRTTCHYEYDRYHDPGVLIIPTDLQYFINFELENREMRRLAEEKGTVLPRQVPTGTMYRDHLLREQVISDETASGLLPVYFLEEVPTRRADLP